MDSIYTTKRRLKNEQADIPNQPEMFESSTYTTRRKLKDSEAASPEKGDCPDVSQAFTDDGTPIITKRKLKMDAKHGSKTEAQRRRERLLAGYNPDDKAADPVIASYKKASERTAELRMAMKKYRAAEKDVAVSGQSTISAQDGGHPINLAAMAEFLVSPETAEKSSLSTLAETKPAKASSSEQNKEVRSAAKLKELICSKVPIINYDHKVYAYTGRSYKLITNYKVLLNIVENRVDKQIFDLSSFKVLECVLDAMSEDENLIPRDYEKRLRESEKYLAFSNCLLNLETLQKEEFSPYWLVTHELNVRYDENASPRAFLKWLDSISDDEEIKRRIVEVLAVLLCGTNLTRSYFVCGTAPSAGKSTFAQMVKHLLSPELVSSVYPSKMSEKFSIGSTKGKLVNLAMDLPRGKLNDQTVSLIKSISGGDAIEHEMKYAHPEMGVSQLRFVFGTNFPLTFSNDDIDSAMWDRCVIVPFTRSISQEDRHVHLLDDLLAEKEAIASFCAKAMKQVIANNYCFSPCRTADEMLEEWKNGTVDAESFAEFFDSRMLYTGNDNDTLLASTIYSAYTEACDPNVKPISMWKMKEWLEKSAGAKWFRRHNKHGESSLSAYKRVRFRDTEEDVL